MAYDETLAGRARGHIGDDPAIVERKMFGGLAYMLNGNMAFGIHGSGLMVRIDAEEHDAALAEPGVRPFDMQGRPMRGWIVVESDAVAEDVALASWIDRGMKHAGSLPPK